MKEGKRGSLEKKKRSAQGALYFRLKKGKFQLFRGGIGVEGEGGGSGIRSVRKNTEYEKG